ncbi:acyl-CoA/acyl-ACP dehydrogenase [Dactylosporangium roseum]|uniref:Acyl-CoA/acyl-ACP dehydrogenase n=1 Tax=Dactylosporangium roseum TaxID=47989 RepID=A0ABY5ZAC8_9ACTN|nr:acyl-CoA dehydrogenase family protein [Dactylosporangium roseum]UWZ39038.1 acyl-CoA/acyl-ACP dehydrogenase [Dactylosporangium roseum]
MNEANADPRPVTEKSRPAVAEELAQIRASVAEVLDERADLRRTHEVMVGAQGHDPRLHELLTADLGLLGLVVPEHLGGLGVDVAAAAAVIEELGARLVPGALATSLTAILAARAVGASAEPLLARVVDEQLTLAIALAEDGTGWDLEQTATRASGTGDEWALTGTKTLVIGAEAARVVLVTARDGDGEPGVYAVDRAADGVDVWTHMTLDQTRRLSTVHLRGAAATRVDAPGGEGARVLLDHVRAMLALESAAAARACLDRTVEYLKVREQFGRAIGSFQALKHRCADLAVAVAGARATADHLVTTLRTGAATRSHDAALAKLVCTDTLMSVAAEAIQMHGGIGFTFEHDAHLFFKRGKSAQLLAGSPAVVRAEVAALAGL